MALPYQAYQLSGSSLVVGLLGLAELCPLLVTAFLGGALADARDRRRMLLLTELSFAGTSTVLLLNATLASPQLWLLFVVAAVMAGLDGLQRPSLEALTQRLVSRDEMPAAAAIGTLRFTIGEIGGPALGGVLIAVVGLPLTYAFDVATFAASLLLLQMMRAAPPPVAGAKVSLHGILEGLHYAAARPVLLGTYAVDIVAMFFGMPNAIFPAFAHEFGGAGVLGLMYAAPAVGALAATLTSGWTGGTRRHGAAICFAAAGWGLAIAVVGLAALLMRRAGYKTGLVTGLLAVCWAAVCFPVLRSLQGVRFPDGFAVLSLGAVALFLGQVIQALASLLRGLGLLRKNGVARGWHGLE